MNEPILPLPDVENVRGWARYRPRLAAELSPSARGRVRLRTLNNLRWMAVAGQSVALFIVYFALNYPLPLFACAMAVGTSAALNLGLAVRYPAAHRLTNREATAYLAYDELQLAALLYFTGGIQNPFALMFLAPVVVGAATLNFGNTFVLALLGFVSISVIAIAHLPLPWAPHEALNLPPLYQVGIWASLVIGIGFTSIYAWRIASEAARMSAGLAATQLALAREHRMASIGALATAAAHELGTPLGTIAVVSHELERALPPQSPEAEDARLLRAEAERCRGILTRLARPEESVIGAVDRLPFGALLDDLANEYRGGDVVIAIDIPQATSKTPEPKVWRSPALLHGLGNVIANAADFARTQVTIRAIWDAKELRVAVEDDGPGFAPDIIERIGEPYVTSRPGSYAVAETELEPAAVYAGEQGMGLGFFIAKTLIEQTHGSLRATNLDRGGARVTARWPRGAIDGEHQPGTSAVL
ncbi:MAG TPA: ActS/PrrB/RegB family redox-sensitive histidine kinase [Rhizomicrobium sp.]|jgi:two-component system sensor histidine kinase RegB|nr:ActS/PrrB/RegB family redox-sensitive histidine kinase [Rhizomicrobium sp.]